MIDRCRRRQRIRTTDSETGNKLFVVGRLYSHICCWVDSCQLCSHALLLFPLLFVSISIYRTILADNLNLICFTFPRGRLLPLFLAPQP